MSELGRLNQSRLVQHTLYGQSITGSDLSVAMSMGPQVTGKFDTCNPGFPRAVRGLNWWLNSSTEGVTRTGDWTLRLRKNRTDSDIATATWNPTTGNDVAYGSWSVQPVLQPTDQYHLLADGPERSSLLIRVILEWGVF